MQQYNKTILKRLTLMLQKRQHNPNWPQILDHPQKILIIRDSGSSKRTNSLFNLINHQPGIDKNYSYANDPYETKYLSIFN